MNLFSYRKLFSVEFMHPFYRSLHSPDILVTPTGHCKTLLANAGLIFKTSPYGFTLYADVNDDGDLKKEIAIPVKFSFNLSLINPFFANFTSLPLEQDHDQCYYFNNGNVNLQDVFDAGVIRSVLNKGAAVSGADRIRVVNQRYAVSYIAPGSSKIFHLIYEDTNKELVNKTVEVSDGIFEFRQILDEFPEGRYRLEVDSAVAERFYYTSGHPLKPIFGILELFSDVPLQNKFITAKKKIKEMKYNIVFQNRSTIWKYRITSKNGIALSNPAIAVGGDTSQFTMEPGLVFTSNNPMGLKEEPQKGIRLLKDSADPASEVLNDLPNPGVEQIIPVRNNGTITIYSEMFIYL